ncbi:MAG: proteasome lid subunit RPN8/RPN11 [Candidatus Nitrosomirales archaeon]|jgi:proteasome lid subunit RPN8/RPN11
MTQRLVLNAKHVSELRKLAADSLPLESCALLVGKINDEDVMVSEIIIANNADKSQVSFSIEPKELLDAYSKAESMGLEIVAIFHSHPAPAKPSGTDVKYMEINPIPWLILSTTNNELAAFLYDGKIHTLEFVVT